jgi:hypothetical protein
MWYSVRRKIRVMFLLNSTIASLLAIACAPQVAQPEGMKTEQSHETVVEKVRHAYLTCKSYSDRLTYEGSYNPTGKSRKGVMTTEFRRDPKRLRVDNKYRLYGPEEEHDWVQWNGGSATVHMAGGTDVRENLSSAMSPMNAGPFAARILTLLLPSLFNGDCFSHLRAGESPARETVAGKELIKLSFILQTEDGEALPRYYWVYPNTFLIKVIKEDYWTAIYEPLVDAKLK